MYLLILLNSYVYMLSSVKLLVGAQYVETEFNVTNYNQDLK